MKLELDNFEKGYELIKSILPATPLIKNELLSKKYNANIYLKLENLQPVGSFKLRGALYKMSKLTEEQKKKGVVAVSAGNHAQGVAFAAQRLGLEATIIMPELSPLTKISNTEALGAKVILKGENVDESFKYVQEYLKENDKTYIHPFCDEDIIAGQGSIGFELKDQIQNIDYIFGSIGGGGLMSGVGFTCKKFFPQIKIVGTQAQGANSMARSLQSGELESSEKVFTFADGIKVKEPNEAMFKILDEIIDDVESISDDLIAKAILDLMEKARIIAEGAGAISYAAFDQMFKESPRRFKGKDIVLLICGGNIDINLVDRIIEKGLIESSRRINIDILLDDRPGALEKLTRLVKGLGANIHQVTHDRTATFLELQESIVKVGLETKGFDHAEEIKDALSKEFKVLDDSAYLKKLQK